MTDINMNNTRTYQVTGQRVQLQAYAVVARCPHFDLSGRRCPGVVSTCKQVKGHGRDELVVYWNAEAVKAFDSGGVVAMRCGQCGSVLEVTKQMIEKGVMLPGPNGRKRLGIVK
jgi:hypothetical protein